MALVELRDTDGALLDIHPAALCASVLAGIVLLIFAIGHLVWLLKSITPAQFVYGSATLSALWFVFLRWRVYVAKRAWRVQQVKDKMVEAAK